MSETTDEEMRTGDHGLGGIGELNYECVDPEDDEDFSKYLLDRMKQLESRNTQLKEQYDQAESEKRYVESQKIKCEREARKLRSEITRLKTVPLIVANVIDILENNKVLVRSSTGPQFMVGVSQSIDDDKLVVGTRVALNQQTLAIVDVLPHTDEPEISAMEVLQAQDVDYDQIGGLEEQIQEIIESVELPLTRPESFERIGISPPNGVMLFGPPGTGKTLLAKAVAYRTDATFIRVVGSELVQKYIGEGSRLVREVFEMARKKAPSILFIDELDAIAATRLNETNGADREVQRTLMQLLAEMDGFDNRGDVRIIAATNRPDILDPAIVRPGRFDRLVSVPLPDKKARESILMVHTRGMAMSNDIDLNRITPLTEGASGADIRAITMEAGMLAVREDRDSVYMEDLLRATTKVMASVKAPDEDRPAAMFG